MKNLFKKLITEGKGKGEEEADQYLTRALVPVLTAAGTTHLTVSVLACGEKPDSDPWGVLIGIRMKKLTALERERVNQIIEELQTFGGAHQKPA